MRYIFNTLQEAENYNNQVSNIENYKGTTKKWDKVLKHPTLSKWAVTFNSKVVLNNVEIKELTSDWFEIPNN